MSLSFHTDCSVESWGRLSRSPHAVAHPRSTTALAQWAGATSDQRLASGARRSYGDTGLLAGGKLIDMTGLDCLRRFDPATGVIVVEPGVTLDALLRVITPLGWFVAVTPGTRYVTIGGAVANDVHGKNHTRAGTFGHHVRRLVIARSDGRVEATPERNADLFAATIGGLGLTGIIIEVELQLQRIRSTRLALETVACAGLDAVCDAIERGVARHEHTVAWVDCTARGASLGRGIVGTADWCEDDDLRIPHRPATLAMLTDRVDGALNPVTLKLFNRAYYRAGALRQGRSHAHYSRVFYPLDAIRGWNRLYGRRGFFQYQCVIPAAAGRAPLRALLETISASGEGSFLAVLKAFGDRPAAGLLSFPQAGWTLALDFRNRGAATLALLDTLDRIVTEARGRLYPAKDARMSPAMFRAGYPLIERFLPQIDPAMQSDFWKRVMS